MSKRRERELYSSTSSTESSPNQKSLKMAEGEVSVITNEMIYRKISAIELNTERIMKENENMRKEFGEMKEACEFQAKAVLELKEANKKLSSELKQQTQETDKLKLNLSILYARINKQDERLDDINQYQRKYNLEIQGIPEKEDEDLKDIITDLADELDVEIDSGDIDIVHRQRSKTVPKPILVKFKCYDDKKSLYDARWKLKNYKGSARMNGADKIYINEHLTPERKQLYAETRKQAKKNGWFNTSTKDGKIFVRKERGGRFERISSHMDLDSNCG